VAGAPDSPYSEEGTGREERRVKSREKKQGGGRGGKGKGRIILIRHNIFSKKKNPKGKGGGERGGG